MPDLDLAAWALVVVSALLIGSAKAGLMGTAMVAVALLPTVFGARESTGIVLPMLIVGDVVAVIYYHRHAEWPVVLRLLPWALAGVGIGALVGERVPDLIFTRIMGAIILASLTPLVIQEFRKKEVVLPERWWIAAPLGLVAGFATMVGNAAGGVMTLYLLSMGFKKNRFIGTAAWYFFVVNLLKVPLHVFWWGTITAKTALIDLAMVPVIVGGALVGLLIVGKIPERPYRIFVLASTALLSIRLFF